MSKKTTLLSALIATSLFGGLALADPPAHAPAHGWRKKNDREYIGHTGKKWSRDYDVATGRCNREEIGTALGAAVGAVIGSRTSDDHRVVATILGAAVGGLIGNRIGRELDEADRGCFGHVLEIGSAGRPVAWTNTRTGVAYVLVPGGGKQVDGKSCRTYSLTATRGAQQEKKNGTACQSGVGEWRII